MIDNSRHFSKYVTLFVSQISEVLEKIKTDADALLLVLELKKVQFYQNVSEIFVHYQNQN